MSKIQILGYHTCSKDNGLKHVEGHAPFHSKTGEPQWLSPGYYFWTDNTYFAYKWGKLPKYKGQYAIVECLIELDSSVLLDLVGNVDDQLKFKELSRNFYERFMKIGRPDLAKKATIGGIIEFYRRQKNKEMFPFIAIKAQDRYDGGSMKFTSKSKEVMPLLTRQQLCLFEDGRICITKRSIIFP